MELGADDRPYRRRVLRGTVATILANSWAMVLGLVTLPLLLSGLGTQAFGVWVLLQTFSVTSGWLSLGDFGLSTSTVRFVAAEESAGRHDHARRVAGTALVAFAALGLFWGALVGLLGPRVLPTLFRVPAGLSAEFEQAVYWFALQTIADFAIQGVLAVLEGAQEIDRSRSLEMLRRTLVTGGSAVAAVAGLGLAGVSMVGFVGTTVALVGSLHVLHRRSRLTVARPQLEALRLLVRHGSSVALLRPLGVLHRTMDRVVVGVVLGPSAVALVEIATQLQNGASAVLGASSYAVTPSAAWLDGRGDGHRLRELVEKGTRYTLLVTFPVVVLTAVLAGPAVALWVGPDYAAAVPLVVLAVGYVAAVAPIQVGSNLLVGIGRARSVIWAATASLGFNLALSLALVGPLGVRGPFVATLISALVQLPLLGRSILDTVDLAPRDFLRSSVLPPAAASVVLGAAALVPVLLPLGPLATLILGACLGIAAYTWAAPAVAMGDGELRDLVRGLRRPARALT